MLSVDEIELIYAAARGDARKVKELLKKGTNPNVKDDLHGYTPLHEASLKCFSDIVEMLLENSADPNIGDNSGFTPLHLAVISGCEKVVSILLKYGADPKIKNSEDKTPVDLARIYHPELLKIFEPQAEITVLSSNGTREIKGDNGKSAESVDLRESTSHDFMSMINILIESVYDNVKKEDYENALFYLNYLLEKLNARIGCEKLKSIVEETRKVIDEQKRYRAYLSREVLEKVEILRKNFMFYRC